MSGALTGSGSFLKAGSGTLTITNSNTFSGTTTLSGNGTLILENQSALGTGAIVQSDANSILRFDTTGTITNNMTLYNFESLRNVTLSGDINAQDATYKIATGKDTILSGNITGTGKLSQVGADDANYRGTLTLTGDNDFEGDTEVDSVLNVGSATALSAQSKLKVNNGGTVKLNGFDSTVAGLEGNGTIQGSAALTAGDENDATFSGILQDGNSGALSLVKKGSGKMTLSGANTFSGNTTLDEGSLEVKNAQALGTGSLSQTDGSSSLIFDTTGTVTNDLSIFSVEFLQDVILSGNIIANNATYDVADGVTMEASGDITGTGGTTKLGLGTQVLSGNNTYTGANDVQAGTLRAGSTTALGDNVATTVDSGAVLELDGFSNSIGSLAGAGTVENASVTAATLTTGADNTSTTFSGVLQDGTGGGALSLTKTGTGTQTLSGTNTFTGDTTISAGTLEIGGAGQLGSGTYAGAIANSGTFNYNSSANQTLSGVISGTGALTKDNTGTLTLSGANTYTGVTTINAGTLQADVADVASTSGALGNGGDITFTGGTLQYTANSAGSDYSSRIKSSTSAISVDTNNNNVTWAGAFAASNTGGLTKEGLGTLTLQPTGAADVAPTGTRTINGGTLEIDLTSASADRQFGGAGNDWVINGVGSSVLISDTIGGAARHGFNSSQWTFGSSGGGTVTINGINPIARNVTITTTGGVTNTFGGDARLNGQGSTTQPVTFDVAAGTDPSGVDLEFSGNAGNLKLVKAGDGVMSITSGANSINVGIDINAGTLELAGSGRLNAGSYSSAIDINGASSIFRHSGAGQTLSGNITGTGSLEKINGSGAAHPLWQQYLQRHDHRG